MKKFVPFLLMTMCLSCNTDSNELTSISKSENENIFHSRINSSLWTLQEDLMRLYSINNSSAILNDERIALIDSLANNLPAFVNLKPDQYTIISLDEVNDIMNNYNKLYQNLNQKPEFLYLLDTIVSTDFNLNTIENEIENNYNLSDDEKEILQFIAYNSHEKWDISWKKRRGIAIIHGYNLSKANAVLNAVLFSTIE